MRLAAAILLAAAALAPAVSRADERFTSLRQRAERVDSLPGFLERFVGACKDAFERRTCEQNVRQSRRAFEGKTLVTTVSAAELARAESDGSRFRIVLTPFIDGGGGYALTHGEPVGQDPAGRPRIGFVVLQGDLRPGVGEMDFRSPFRTGFVEMEVVFRAEGTWKMRRRDGGYYEGVWPASWACACSTNAPATRSRPGCCRRGHGGGRAPARRETRPGSAGDEPPPYFFSSAFSSRTGT